VKEKSYVKGGKRHNGFLAREGGEQKIVMGAAGRRRRGCKLETSRGT